MTHFRILEGKNKPMIAIKKGFCWPALIGWGFFWALYKRFWPLVLVSALVPTFVKVVLAVLSGGSTGDAAVGLFIFAYLVFSAAIAKYFNFLYTAYMTDKGYEVTSVVEAQSETGALREAKDNKSESKKDLSPMIERNGTAPL